MPWKTLFNPAQLITCFALTLAVFGQVLPRTAHAAEFEKVYVFGDSLSDTGNSLVATGGVVPFPTHYNSGRFSNGPVWVDYIAAELGSMADSEGFALPASLRFLQENGTPCPVAAASCSYAFGGSATQDAATPSGVVPGLLSQIGLFASELPPGGADPEALYIVWSGANNYLFPAFNSLFGPIFGPPLASDQPDIVIADILGAVEFLTSVGARKIMVVNLPDLGDAPLTAPELAGAVTPELREQLTVTTLEHNSMLTTAIMVANDTNVVPGRSLMVYDAFAQIKQKTLKPVRRKAGPASGCLLPLFFPNPPCDPAMPPDFNGKLKTRIWDEQHPTTKLHKTLGRRAFRVIDSF